MKFKTYIIHLERAHERRDQVDKLVGVLPNSPTVFAAIDAKDLSTETLKHHYRSHLYAPRYPFALNPGEIATFLSHRAVWKAIADENTFAALVVEDDVEPTATFANSVRRVAELISDGDYVRFAKYTREKPGSVQAEDDGLKLFEPKSVGLGMLAQLVTPYAAAQLLAATEQFDRPVDTFLQLRKVHDVTIKCVHPVLVHDISSTLGGTTVQEKLKSPIERVSREIKRGIYRAKLMAADH